MAGGEKPPDPGGKNGMETDANGAKQRETFEYTIKDSAPYRVMFVPRNGNKEVKINRYSLGSKIRGMETFKKHVVDMKISGRNKILVFLNSYQRANQLVEYINKEEGIYTAFIPKHLVCISGVIAGIPVDIPIEQIHDDLESDVPIVSVHRLTRYEDGNRVPSTRISITFRASQLPERVRLFCCVTKVKTFDQKVIYCTNCLRFNHRGNDCKGVRRCGRCTERHDSSEEFETCEQTVKCVHCKANTHTTGSESCPAKKREQQIKAIMSRTNYTYVEAKEMVAAPLANYYEPLNNLQDFPTTAETVAVSSNLSQQWQKTNALRVPVTAAVRTYPEKKPNNQTKKRRPNPNTQTSPTRDSLTEEEECASQGASGARPKTTKQQGEKPVNGTGLNNPFKVEEKERWSHIIDEANRRAEINTGNKYQSAVMSFYSEFIGESNMDARLEEKFKQCAMKYFNLQQAIV